MNKVTHKTDAEGNVVIEATGDLLSYEAIIVPKTVNGKNHIPKYAIDTSHIDNSQEVRDEIIESIQRKRGINGEAPLVVDKDL